MILWSRQNQSSLRPAVILVPVPRSVSFTNSLQRSTDSPESTSASPRQPPPGRVKVALGSLLRCGSLSHFHHPRSLAQHPGTRWLHSQPNLALEGETSSQCTQIHGPRPSERRGLWLQLHAQVTNSYFSCHKLLLKTSDTKPTTTFSPECLCKQCSERYTMCWPHRFRGFRNCQHSED